MLNWKQSLQILNYDYFIMQNNNEVKKETLPKHLLSDASSNVCPNKILFVQSRKGPVRYPSVKCYVFHKNSSYFQTNPVGPFSLIQDVL